MSKRMVIIACAGVAVALATGAYFAFLKPAHDCEPTGVIAGGAEIGGPFQLVTHKAVSVTEKDVIKGLTLVYFGYTFCPDICPLDMARNIEAVDLLDEDGIDVTPVFITIDPARDTPQVLSDYVDVMHPKMIGLTGTESQILSAAKAYKTFYRKQGDGEDYLVDHMRFTYLMSPDGFLDFVRSELTAEELATAVAEKAACYAK
ncbi:MAG: SCO family protein [Proteobacteria bacterium]|nr:SCO family protein [Pseudomonadota bacterium]